MFNSWSIKSLLQLWSLATIVAILSIAIIALYSNLSFTKTQNELTSHTLPMENASRQLSYITAALITNDSLNRITRLISQEQLSQAQLPQNQLKEQFEKYLTQIKNAEFSSQYDSLVIESLFDEYQKFLVADQQLSFLVKQQNTTNIHLQKKLEEVDVLERQINQDIKTFLAQIDLQLDPVNEARIQQLGQSLQLTVQKIINLNQKIIQSKNTKQLLDIADNDIKQHEATLENDIKQINKILLDNIPLERIKKLNSDIKLFIQTAFMSESSIYQLVRDDFESNNNLALGQQEPTLRLQAMSAQLEQLSTLISEQKLTIIKHSASAAEQIRWLILLLGSMIILGMLRFIIAISRRINNPLSELQTAMRALSAKNFATRLTAVSGKSEFAIMAKNFNLFAENTQKLINDLAEARDSLQAQKEYITAILNSVPEAILVITTTGVIESTNSAANEVLKANENTLIGLNILQFFDKSQNVQSIKDIAALQQNSQEFNGLYFNKQPFHMWVSLSPIATTDNTIWVCVISDINSWKLTEASLKTKSSELNAILENAMVGIAFIKDRQFLHVNHKFETLFACKRAQVAGIATRQFYLSDIAFEQFNEQVEAVLERGESFEGQLEMLRHNGERFWCSVSSKAIDDENPQQGTIWLFDDVTHQRQNEERLVSLASFDGLTGLPNRAVFLDRLEHALHKAHRESGTLAVFFLDLDHFKHINDSLGHKAGDQLLCDVASRLQSSIRGGDTVARLGGDEFTIILEDVRSAQYVAKVAEKILIEISKTFLLGSMEVNISPSIGISLYPADGRDMDMLLRNADAAMYHAKDNGRNNFQFYSAEMNAKAAERLIMETSLRRAVEMDELYLHFQPQIDLKTGKVISAEALLRWDSKPWGSVSPADFVPILEDTGLIGVVGEMVLRRACQAYMALKDKLDPNFRIAVNLSGRQFKGGQLVSYVKQLLSELSMSPNNLELEITESILMDNTDLAITTLSEFSAMGVTLAMDDFGTGYSSLSYLKQFPLNVLKIDRSFVNDVNDDINDAAIVAAILAMSHRLKLSVVAEGVETKEQLDFLRAHDCSRVQGYYFSKPLSFEDFSLFVEQDEKRLESVN